MKKEIWLGKKTLRFFYFRYKDSFYYSLSIIVLIVLVCFIFIFNIIIPRFQSWLSIREEVIATQERIKIINKNINFMNNIDRSILDRQSDTALAALPVENDFGPILTTISSAAVNSNISLDDFSFTIGGDNSATNGLSFITITLIAHGDIGGIQLFIKDLEERLPLSQVAQIDGSSQFVSIKVQFYRKDFPTILVRDDEQILPLSDKKLALLKKLTEWKNKSAELLLPAPSETQESSPSASAPLF